jgi:hypothetical protein
MLDLKKLVAAVLILTFLVSIPLAVVQIEADVFAVQFTVEYDESYGRPSEPPGLAKPPKGDSDDDYKIWFNRYTVSYVPMDMVVYTSNPKQDFPTGFVFAAVCAAADAWDAVTADLLVESKTEKSGTTSVQRDEENAVFFGNYPTGGVIAVATVWIDRRSKTLLECDIMFDTDWKWGNALRDDGTIDSSVMDLQNIATHELGHCFNLADIYDSSLSYLTMYGYSEKGDVEKRDLADGDIAGIQSLFGVPKA